MNALLDEKFIRYSKSNPKDISNMGNSSKKSSYEKHCSIVEETEMEAEQSKSKLVIDDHEI